MATKAEKEAFLKRIKPGCFAVYKQIKLLPSVIAAQTALESGWGRSHIQNNYWGIKSFNPSEPRVKKWTYEDGPGGRYGTFAYFRTFNSLEEGFTEGYQALLNKPRYARALGLSSALETITAIKQAGYATDVNYVSLIMGLIRANNLEKWDEEALAGGDGGASSSTVPQDFFTFNTNLIDKNTNTRPGHKLTGVIGIVLKDAGSPGSGLGSVRSYFARGASKGGVHIIIDKSDTECIVPLNEVVFHSDPTKNIVDIMSGSSKEYPNGNMNLKTISIGLCRESDGSYHEGTVVRAVAVIAELLNHYNLPTNSVYRRLDLDGSPDPLPYYEDMFQYSTLLGLVNYQKNQDTPLINEDLIKKYEEAQESQSGGGSSESGGAQTVINAASGSRRKILEKAFEIQGWGLTYSQPLRYQIRPGGYSDCSSYTQYVYKNSIGVDPGINTTAQIARGVWVDRKDALPGDLVHWRGHVGIVTDKGGNWTIHSGVSGYRKGESIKHVRINMLSQSMAYIGIKRYITDYDSFEEDQVSSPNIGGNISLSGLDPTKEYFIHIKEAFNSYSSDSNSGTTYKRVAKDSKLKVLSMGAFGYRVGEGEWILKRDSSKYEIKGTDRSKQSSLGVARVIGYAEEKTQPSLASSSHIQYGRAKVQPQGSMVSIYGERNGMILISPPESMVQSWVAGVSLESDFTEMEKMSTYYDGVSPGGDGTGTQYHEARVVKFKAVVPKSEYDSSTGRVTKPGTLGVSSKEFIIGASAEVNIPSSVKHNQTYYIGGVHQEARENIVYIYMEDPSEAALFGERQGTIRVISNGT